jgi:hypothetical protein
MKRLMPLPRLCLCLCLLGGCAVFADKADYADYRAVRLAADEEAVLLASRRYTAKHPDGRWHDEVAADLRARETALYASRKGSRTGLDLYLSIYPDGAFAPQARARLRALDAVRARRQRDAERAGRAAEQRRARDAENRRTWVSRFTRFWTTTFLSLTRWGAPIADVARANPGFSRAFAASPRPRCTRTECVKHYASQYALPVPGGTRLERSVRLILRLSMDGGLLVRAELLMPGSGFSRWYELENRSAVIDEDAEDRGRAVAWALKRLERALVAVAPEAAASAAVPPGLLEPPAFASLGEPTDTAADNPGDASGPGAEAPASVEEILADTEAEAPDVVMAPLEIPPEGRSVAVPDMVMEPLEVPVEGGETVETGPAGGETLPAEPDSGPGAGVQARLRTVTYETGTLRITMFADAPDREGTVHDGIRIEPLPRAERSREPEK